MTVKEFKENGRGIFVPNEIYYNIDLTPEQRFVLAVSKCNDIQFENEKEEAKFHGISEKKLREIKQILEWKGYLDRK